MSGIEKLTPEGMLHVIAATVGDLVEAVAYGKIADQLEAGGVDFLDVEAAVQDAQVTIAGVLEELARNVRSARVKSVTIEPGVFREQ